MFFQNTIPVVPIRGLHLDLKGTPPTFPRLLDLLDLFAALRYNLIVVEWEDMFPWMVDFSFRSSNAYNEEEVRAFAAKAARLGIEVVPLVQTLGHMENFLKAPGRTSLREHPDSDDVLNPLAPGAPELVRSLVEDVLRVLPDVKYFHLGGDEAWHLGVHPRTATFIRENSADALYLHHMQPLLDGLNARKIRPLLWHDMMLKWDDEALRNMGRQADIVFWGYHGHPDESPHHFSSRQIARFAELGLTIFGATAFKGAEGTNVDRPIPAARMKNAAGWVELSQRHHLAGLITTGWSRYCYNTCQCETLEASLDTLLAQAFLMHDGYCPTRVMADAPALIGKLWKPEEGERYARIRTAADRFAEAHEELWYCVRTHLSHLAAIQHDPARKLSSFYMNTFEKARAAAQKNAEEYRTALSPLIPDSCLESYFMERLQAVDAVRNMRCLAKP